MVHLDNLETGADVTLGVVVASGSVEVPVADLVTGGRDPDCPDLADLP